MKEEIKAKEEFVNTMMHIFTAPTIVWPMQEPTINKNMLEKAKTSRLIAAMKHEKTATEFEAMLYISTVSACFPLNETWTRIYTYLFKRCMPNPPKEVVENSRDPEEYEMYELQRLRDWIYKKQMEDVKSSTKILSRKYEQSKLS